MKPKRSKNSSVPSSKAELDAFLEGNPDPGLIQRYLELDDSTELARLAAMMAPKPMVGNARALVDAAIALQEEAESGLLRKREKLAGRMNFMTLLQAITQLQVDTSLVFGHGSEPEFSDSMVGPLLRVARTVMVEANARSSAEKLAELQAELEELARKRSVPLPPTPCDTITALRFAIHADNSPEELLINAFKDFLGLRYDEDNRWEDESNLRELQSVQDDITKFKSPSKQQLDYLERLKKTVQVIKKERDCRDKFTPEKGLIEGLRKKGSDLFDSHWAAVEPLLGKQDLRWLATDFHAFWMRHCKSYKKRYQVEETRRKAVSAVRRKVARSGVEAREEKKWNAFTDTFCRYLIAKNVRTSKAFPADLMPGYFDQLQTYPSDAMRTKLRDFFGSLWVLAVAKPPSSDTSVLRRGGVFMTLSDEAILGCRDKVGAAIKMAPRKT